MFGYVIANQQSLSQQELARYRSCYCGLCRALCRRHGTVCRFVLHYDMVFLAMLLSSMYEPEERQGSERCLVHPIRRHGFAESAALDYAADMNIALAYHNCMDDWNDEHSRLRLYQARLLRGHYETVAERYPEQCSAIERCLAELSDIEQRAEQDPDGAANCFGRLMGTLFLWKQDRWADTLYAMGESLGRFVYIMDAVTDLPGDVRRGRYNPLVELQQEGRTAEDWRSVLEMLIGDCTEQFERLPLVQDVSILKNILYSGVWQRFELEQARRKEQKGRAGHVT